MEEGCPMNFEIYVLDEVFEKFYMDAIKEYDKRLKKYCKIRLIRLKNNEELQSKLTDRHYVILVRTKGQNLSSEEFAEKISSLSTQGNSKVAFVIGLEYAQKDEDISMTTIDLSASLTTVCLYEQIYRGYRILKNEPYHK
jgi:23S rRNA (pseudouridine1915-N3)-methyltransferase